MKKTDLPPLPPAVRALADEERRGLHFTPTEEGLIAYQAGTLTEAEAEQVRAYLALDPEAARFVADLDQFLEDADDEGQHLSEHESARVQRDLRAALAARPTAPDESIPGIDQDPFPGRGKRFVAAASILVTLTGASVAWSVYQQGKLGEMATKVADLQAELEQQRQLPMELSMVRLYSISKPGETSDTRGPGDAWTWTAMRISPGQKDFFLVVPRPLALPYRAEVTDAEGRVIEPSSEIQWVPDTSVQVVRLSAAKFPPGRYLLRVTVPSTGNMEPEIYPFAVIHTGTAAGESP